jgi:hypothetical protein
MQPHDEAIFVAGDGRRARRLGRAAAAATFLAVLWVVGLGIGMLGFDSLPGISLVRSSHADPPATRVTRAPAVAGDTDRADFAAKSTDEIGDPSRANLDRAQTKARAQSDPSARPAAQVVATQPAAPPPAAVNPAQRVRGWSRKGNPAPPGQVRKAQPPPAPPATSKGRRVGQTKSPPAPAVPPGQAKKALEPPPPPPPPPKKG